MHTVVFGAGNIGRGFLGLLLHHAGHHVTFIDVDERKIRELNTRRSYPVYVVANGGIERTVVTDVRGVLLDDRIAVLNALADADLILTAVGKNALAEVAPLLALALRKRADKGDQTIITVVACENVHDNTQYLRECVLASASDQKDRASLDAITAFPNCVVDRIVPNALPMEDPNPLAVAVEDYFQFAVDANRLKGGFPVIPGVELSPNLDAVLEQKLCTLNAAHAVIAYWGYVRNYSFIHEAVLDEDILALVHGMFEEVEYLLTRRHTTIRTVDQRQYAAKVVSRFENPYLRDDVTRVARQPKRKLSPDDRLVKPAQLLAAEQGLQPVYLATGITAALRYDFHGDTQAQELVTDIREQGVARVLQNVAGIDPESDLGRMVAAGYVYRGL